MALFVSGAVAANAQTVNEGNADVTRSVQAYMRCFPQSQLRDLYKFCFQDYFGPEHIISDSLGAVRYINYEIAHADSNDWLNPPFVYPLGLDGNYYRVDIDYVRLGIVPMGVFVSALLESAKPPFESTVGEYVSPDIGEWQGQWQLVMKSLRDVYPQPLNFEADSTLIAQTLQSGNYAIHHSALFNSVYRQHYRIIRRDVFMRRLSAYIPNPYSPCSKN